VFSVLSAPPGTRHCAWAVRRWGAYVLNRYSLIPPAAANSVDRQNQTHAATHNICGLCVPRRRCPVVPLSLRLKRESELQDLSCVLTQLGFTRSAPPPPVWTRQRSVFYRAGLTRTACPPPPTHQYCGISHRYCVIAPPGARHCAWVVRHPAAHCRLRHRSRKPQLTTSISWGLRARGARDRPHHGREVSIHIKYVYAYIHICASLYRYMHVYMFVSIEMALSIARGYGLTLKPSPTTNLVSNY